MGKLYKKFLEACILSHIEIYENIYKSNSVYLCFRGFMLNFGVVSSEYNEVLEEFLILYFILFWVLGYYLFKFVSDKIFVF